MASLDRRHTDRRRRGGTRLEGVNPIVVERSVWAWVLTIPCAGGLAYVFLRLLHLAIPS